MGLGFGGEWTAGAVLIGEVIRARDRGKAVGLVQAGWAIGWGVSTLLFMASSRSFPPTTRGACCSRSASRRRSFVIWIRRFVEEPEVHRRQKEGAGCGAGASFACLIFFRGDIVWTTLRASILATGVQGGYYAG